MGLLSLALRGSLGSAGLGAVRYAQQLVPVWPVPHADKGDAAGMLPMPGCRQATLEGAARPTLPSAYLMPEHHGARPLVHGA